MAVYQFQIPGYCYYDQSGVDHQFQIPGYCYMDEGTIGGDGPGGVFSVNTVSRSVIKTMDTVAIASVKSVNTVT